MESISMRSHRSCPSRGAKRRSCLRLVVAWGRSPNPQSCNRRPRGARDGVELGLSSFTEDSSTRGSRPVPTMEPARKNGGNRHPHGSLSRTRRRSARRVEEREPERRQAARRSSRWRKSPVPAAIRCRRTDRAPARPAGEARNRPFVWVVLTIVSSWQKSDERHRRRRRAQHRETEAACRSETQRGGTPEARVIARPMEGALDHQYLRRPSRVVVSGWSRPRARRPSRPVGGGVSSGKRKPKEG